MLPDSDLATPRPLRDGEDPNDLLQAYWRDGDRVVCREAGGTPLRGADAGNFVYYAGGFGCDGRHAWFMGSRLRDADGRRFRALNYAWFGDGAGVWCVGGRVRDADGAHFEACDAGVQWINDTPIPRSYGRDGGKVFFYDFNGKANWVRKADPASFESLEGALFGRDARHVFHGHATIAGADRARWRMLGGHYSRDERRVYYANRIIEDADAGSFRVVPSRRGDLPLARDAHRRYLAGTAVDGDAWAGQQWQRDALEPA